MMIEINVRCSMINRVDYDILHMENGVRPVFCLNSNIRLIGTGVVNFSGEDSTTSGSYMIG